MEYYLLIEVTELSSNEHNTDEPYTLIANWKKSDKKKNHYILCGSNSMNFWKGKHLKKTLKASVDAKDSGEEAALARWNTRDYCFKRWNYSLQYCNCVIVDMTLHLWKSNELQEVNFNVYKF